MLSCCRKCLQEQLAPLGPGHALPALPASSRCQHQHLCSCKVKWIREPIQLNTNPGEGGRGVKKKKKLKRKSLFSAGSVAQAGSAFILVGHVLAPGEAAAGGRSSRGRGSRAGFVAALVTLPEEHLSGCDLVLMYYCARAPCSRGDSAGLSLPEP